MIDSFPRMDYYSPGVQLELNGSELAPEAAHCVRSVTVEQTLNATNTFSLVIQDTSFGGRFRWLDGDFFQIADSVSISLGYARGKTCLLKGKIHSLNASFETGCAPCLTVEGSDSAYELLTTDSETRVFQGKTDGEIVREIAQEVAQLTPDVDPTEGVSEVKIKPGGKSFLHFIQGLAKENHFTFYLGGGKLAFKRREAPSAVAAFNWGQDTIRFEPRLNTTGLCTEVLVRAWDAKSKRTIEGRASATDEDAFESGKRSACEIGRAAHGTVVKLITGRPARSVEEARQIAAGELNRLNAGLVRATLETVGRPELTPGRWVSVGGFGTLFSGCYFVVRAVHTLRDDGYRTTLELRRNAL